MNAFRPKISRIQMMSSPLQLSSLQADCTSAVAQFVGLTRHQRTRWLPHSLLYRSLCFQDHLEEDRTDRTSLSFATSLSDPPLRLSFVEIVDVVASVLASHDVRSRSDLTVDDVLAADAWAREAAAQQISAARTTR